MTTLNPLDIKDLFQRAKIAYGQTGENFYESSKSIAGLHLAVLPPRDEYIFSFFNFGDDDDVREINKIWRENRVFKTFGCTLCPIQDEDNAVVVSNTQNQLYLDPNTPSIQVQTTWKSENRNGYIITATLPQYYYNHLLFLSADHVPTYSLFLKQRLFTDAFEYLSKISDSETVTAIFNGGFGSDIYHFHLHLTSQKFSVIEDIWNAVKENFETDLVYRIVNQQIIRGIVFTSDNLDSLFVYARQVGIYYITTVDRDQVALTANLSVRKINGKQIYMIFLQMVSLVTNKRDSYRTSRNIQGCDYFLIPAGYILNAQCLSFTPRERRQFERALVSSFNDVYLPISDELIQEILKIPDTSLTRGNIVTARDLNREPLEKVYYLTDQYFQNYKYYNQPLSQKFIQDLTEVILNILNTGADCFKENCQRDYDAKFRYLLGVYITLLSEQQIVQFLNDPKLADFRISSSIKYLYNYNGGQEDMIQSDYLYFRGTFLASLLRKTFKNLLLATQTGDVQSPAVNDWLKFIFNRIGEPSGFGVNTVSKLRGVPTVDFVMKIMVLGKVPEYVNNGEIVLDPQKVSEFTHEFMTALEINKFRQYIPNFILCYGGFQCPSDAQFSCNSRGRCLLTDVKRLCAGSGKMPLSYILFENIKNSKTVTRHIKTPNVAYPLEANDYADMILQIVTSLVYGWSLGNFTHYDLHTDNVMAYDFIKNPNYLKLFKIWSEYEGSRVPRIDNIYFVYYGIGDKPIIIPTKYLYLIIDYGGAYVKGLSKYHVFPEWVQHFGVTSDRPNSIIDVYRFCINLLFNLSMHKPYLIYDEQNQRWMNNKLSKIFIKVLRSYKAQFVTVEKVIEQLPMISSTASGNRRQTFMNYFNSILTDDPKYYVRNFQYLSKNFTPDLVANDFNSPERVLNWIYTNLYNHNSLKSDLQNPDVYVFNWGGSYLPKGILQGIEPNEAIEELINTRNEKQKQSISKVRRFANALD